MARMIHNTTWAETGTHSMRGQTEQSTALFVAGSDTGAEPHHRWCSSARLVGLNRTIGWGSAARILSRTAMLGHGAHPHQGSTQLRISTRQFFASWPARAPRECANVQFYSLEVFVV